MSRLGSGKKKQTKRKQKKHYSEFTRPNSVISDLHLHQSVMTFLYSSRNANKAVLFMGMQIEQ